MFLYCSQKFLHDITYTTVISFENLQIAEIWAFVARTSVDALQKKILREFLNYGNKSRPASASMTCYEAYK